MKNINSIIVLFFYAIQLAAQSYFPVGTWRDHLPYSNFQEFAILNDIVYSSTPYSLIEINQTTNEIIKHSKVNGLSEIGISSIAANTLQNTLVVAYESSNIDLVKEDQIINFPAILNSNITGDKSIYEMVCSERYVYVCTGFGIVVIDLNRTEVKDTYIIGPNSSQIKINDVYINSDSIFALTEFGIKAASLSNLFLSDPNSWTDIPTPLNFLAKNLEDYGNDFLAYNDNGTILKYSYGNWDTLINNPHQNFSNVRFYDNKLMICNEANLTVLDTNLDTVIKIFSYSGNNGINPNDIYFDNEFYWLADENNGIRKVYNNWSSEEVINQGPYTNDVFQMSFGNDKLYISTGRVYGSAWSESYNWKGIYEKSESSWKMYNRKTVPIMADQIDTISDIIWVTADEASDENFYASSFSGGLLLFENGDLNERYSYYNSSLQPRNGTNSNRVYVSSTDFDKEGNLWVANPFTLSPLSVKTTDGEWKSFYCGSQASNSLCTDLIVDSDYGNIYMVIKGVGVLVYDFNQTPLEVNDDQYKIIGTGEGSGSLPSSQVNTLAIDNDGDLWIGTDLGPVVFYNTHSIFNDLTYDVQKILIDTGGVLQYLLENENITDILIDGANRKWISTDGGGLFLMSEDGTQTILNLSKFNSPLFSNNINSLAMDHSSGELFIGTDKGVVGYRSTATSPSFLYNELKVFPNPVRPDYNGAIAINGMLENSEVKITNSNGILVKTLISDGGQAIWYGKNEFNEPVKTGIYYIFATSEDGTSNAKSKILIIR